MESLSRASWVVSLQLATHSSYPIVFFLTLCSLLTIMFKVPAIANILYCPRQVPMGTRSSKCQKLMVGSCTEEVLKWFNYLLARAHPRCEVSWGYWIDLHHRFVEASPTVEKAVTCYKADRLVASFPSFHSIQSSLAVREFHSAGEECSERDHGQVCVNLMSWHPKHIRTITAMWAQGPTFGFTMQGSSMMGRLHRGPRKTTKLSNWGVGACAGIGACPGQ